MPSWRAIALTKKRLPLERALDILEMEATGWEIGYNTRAAVDRGQNVGGHWDILSY